MSDETQETIAEVVKQVADAMSDAIKQYGPDAVDLALMAYRVDAVQQLLHGAAYAASIGAAVYGFMRFWNWSATKIDGSYSDETYYVGRAIFGIVLAFASLFLGLSAADRLLDASAWLAAFGWPELRIAVKALEAAGLM